MNLPADSKQTELTSIRRSCEQCRRVHLILLHAIVQVRRYAIARMVWEAVRRYPGQLRYIPAFFLDHESSFRILSSSAAAVGHWDLYLVQTQTERLRGLSVRWGPCLLM